MEQRQSAVEVLGVNQFNNIYCGKKVVITGHTGFKGSWLTLWLTELGAEVTGIALDPETNPNHWSLLNIQLENDYRIDIRNYSKLSAAITATEPDIVFHLAAQPLVRRSYQQPLETWSTNVMGTANLLEACRHMASVQAIVAITTDKCYANHEWPWGYREIDQLGGHDPYSASKAGSEFVAASYRSAFFSESGKPLLATCRTGNVIGGGDWSEDRLIPDLIHAITANQIPEIRSPYTTRPWQHVLESLSGYLLLGKRLLEGKRDFAEAWNFGPEPDGNRQVNDILTTMKHHWSAIKWQTTDIPQPHEANLLYLDSAKARSRLPWHSVWSLEQALRQTVSWYQNWLEQNQIISLQQLNDYVEQAHKQHIGWVTNAGD